MGQAAKCNVSIVLNEDAEMPLGMTSETALEQSMLKYYYDTNPEAVRKPNITITEFVNYDNAVIELELYSTRIQNLNFQVDLLQDYLDVMHSDIIAEVTEDKWIQI